MHLAGTLTPIMLVSVGIRQLQWHALRGLLSLQGSDGYHRHWKGYGQIYTGPIHEGNYGGKDYLQIQDLVTGEVEYFR